MPGKTEEHWGFVGRVKRREVGEEGGWQMCYTFTIPLHSLFIFYH